MVAVHHCFVNELHLKHPSIAHRAHWSRPMIGCF
uniref:Uncharacterized protein n=1 Tax=Anguilla anguilla TaxID=7936 RepID=A0A0E9UGK9_ANGAN